MKKHYLGGFTLMEILIVVAILGLLGIVSFLFVPAYFMRARDATRKYDLEQMRVAIENSYDTQGYYSSTIAGCNLPFTADEDTVLKRTPCDPLYDTPYQYVTDETGQSRWYKLYTRLEYTQDADIDRVGCRTGCGPNCMYNYGIASPNKNVMLCSELLPLSQSPPQIYACAPGGGQTGRCELFENPERSECPKAYPNDSTCKNECDIQTNRCHDASGF